MFLCSRPYLPRPGAGSKSGQASDSGAQVTDKNRILEGRNWKGQLSMFQRTLSLCFCTCEVCIKQLSPEMNSRLWRKIVFYALSQAGDKKKEF